MVGEIGMLVGTYNKVYFGYLSFIYPFVLVFLTIFIYKHQDLDLNQFSVIFPSFLIVLAIIMFQAHVVSGDYDGAIGWFIVGFLKKFIGGAGVWIFILALLTLGFILLNEVIYFKIPKSINFSEFLSSIKHKFEGFIYSDSKEDLIIPNAYEQRPNPIKQSVTAVLNEEKEVHIDCDSLTLPDSLESLLDTQQEIKETKISPKSKKTQNIKGPSEELQINQTEKNVKELESNRELLDKIEKVKQGKIKKPENFKLPYFNFLKPTPKTRKKVDDHEIDQKIFDLKEKLLQFKIEGDVIRTYSGPVVTTFEFRPAAHIKVSKILTLQDDLAMALKAQTIRIQAPIPGKDVVGIEIPNKHIDTIYLKEILKSDIFQQASSPLTMVLGRDIVGNPFVTDLTKLPHLLIAGTTGSGKSVGINAMLLSLLYRNSPDDLKLLMIDPKMLELSIYNDIPHLLTPVITKPKQAILALSNMVIEMERRYKLMSKTKTKNIENYNEKASTEHYEPFPYIVVIIDELADLMMTSGKDVEFYIARLAQMARASGIHLIVATQRPSVDVVTGLIKANLPSRISFRVGQKIDSKVILDSSGADSLLGRGDMLFTPPGSTGLIRLHAPFVTEKEIETIVEFLKVQREVQYDPTYLNEPSDSTLSGSAVSMGGEKKSVDNEDFDELYDEAKNIIFVDKKTSISYLQRKLQIGYNRSARIIEQLEMTGVLSAPNTKGQREILE